MKQLTKKEAIDLSEQAKDIIDRIQREFGYTGGIFMARHEIEKWQSEVLSLVNHRGELRPLK